MEGDILAPLEPRYYRTLKTGMTVTEPHSYKMHFHDHHVCAHGSIVLTMQSQVFVERIFMPSRLGHGL